jgi:hypothetical protein
MLSAIFSFRFLAAVLARSLSNQKIKEWKKYLQRSQPDIKKTE